tara:strand:+ start:3075 stop:3464 length:390 start_codon:yes stop_codon:yes gene_type:complete
MKKIKDIEDKELVIMCNELIFKTVLECNQSKDEKWLLARSVGLANDLKIDFDTLTFQDITQSFREGVRKTENTNTNIVLSVNTFYRWIKAHRQLIWDNTAVDTHRQDKRLRYRSGTGMKQISNIKTLKL